FVTRMPWRKSPSLLIPLPEPLPAMVKPLRSMVTKSAARTRQSPAALRFAVKTYEPESGIVVQVLMFLRAARASRPSATARARPTKRTTLPVLDRRMAMLLLCVGENEVIGARCSKPRTRPTPERRGRGANVVPAHDYVTVEARQ